MPDDTLEKVCPWACALAHIADPSTTLGELLSEMGSVGEWDSRILFGEFKMVIK